MLTVIPCGMALSIPWRKEGKENEKGLSLHFCTFCTLPLGAPFFPSRQEEGNDACEKRRKEALWEGKVLMMSDMQWKERWECLSLWGELSEVYSVYIIWWKCLRRHGLSLEALLSRKCLAPAFTPHTSTEGRFPVLHFFISLPFLYIYCCTLHVPFSAYISTTYHFSIPTTTPTVKFRISDVSYPHPPPARFWWWQLISSYLLDSVLLHVPTIPIFHHHHIEWVHRFGFPPFPLFSHPVHHLPPHYFLLPAANRLLSLNFPLPALSLPAWCLLPTVPCLPCILCCWGFVWFLSLHWFHSTFIFATHTHTFSGTTLTFSFSYSQFFWDGACTKTGGHAYHSSVSLCLSIFMCMSPHVSQNIIKSFSGQWWGQWNDSVWWRSEMCNVYIFKI